MDILAASLGGSVAKTVVVKKKKDMLFLNSAKKMSVQELQRLKKTNEIKMTFDFDDFFLTEIELPPLKDPKSMSLLIKNRVSDLITSSKDEYTFVYHEATVGSSDTAPSITEQTGVPRKKYTVFGLQPDFVSKYGITQPFMAKANLITLDQFALGYLSAKVDPVGFVCHIFADENKIIFSFSMGNDQVYSRITSIPAGITNPEDLHNFYYETINLTYLYIKQNKQKEISTIIMSGLLDGDNKLIESVEKFAGVKVTKLRPEMFIKGCDNRTFHDFVLAIGCAFAKDNSNFLPISLKENKAYESILKKVSAAILILSIGVSGYAFTLYSKYSRLEEDFQRRLNALQSKIASLDGTISKKSELIYINGYLNVLRQRDDTPVSSLKASQKLLGEENFNSVEFKTNEQGKIILIVKNQEELATYYSTYEFGQEYKAKLGEINSLKVDNKNGENEMSLKLMSRTYDMDTELIFDK